MYHPHSSICSSKSLSAMLSLTPKLKLDMSAARVAAKARSADEADDEGGDRPVARAS
jgi:hypothetical protein